LRRGHPPFVDETLAAALKVVCQGIAPAGRSVFRARSATVNLKENVVTPNPKIDSYLANAEEFAR